MRRWRFRRSWPPEELERWHDRAETLSPNFDVDGELSPSCGWNRVRSVAWVATESPGPPEKGGVYDRLWEAIRAFEHSDPRIVVVHHRGGDKLLLELKAMGLHFLCPARFGPSWEHGGPTQTTRAMSLETLSGHIERGREWFLLHKEHGNGEVRFRIEAGWLPGDFPNWWSRLGFHAVGRRYQRAWHRLAHLRLRRIADPSTPWGDLAAAPVQFHAIRGLRRGIEMEGEEMQSKRFLRAAGLGAASGLRSLSGPAIVWGRRAAERKGFGGQALRALAAGELVADKLPFAPDRTRAPSLVGRVASGALVGSSVMRGKGRLLGALLGGGAALASTFLFFAIRQAAARRSRWLGRGVAFGEDALALWAGSRLANQPDVPSEAHSGE